MRTNEIIYGRDYRCIKNVVHPNIGVLLRKGENYLLEEDNDDETVIIGGFHLYKHLFLSHFEPLEKAIKKDTERLKDLKIAGFELMLDDMINRLGVLSTIKYLIEDIGMKRNDLLALKFDLEDIEEVEEELELEVED